MSVEVAGEARARPLSAGLWSLLGWLRRDESASSDSLSSGGSDLTAASFAFLPPANYHLAVTPLVLPPQPPPTDSYKKRIREQIIRRRNERDITLHRKYGLPFGEHYDALTLPAARRSQIPDKEQRDRRATSESLGRRTAHVPGKRRAPPPPQVAARATTPRQRAPKRRAPQPPTITPDGPNVNPSNNITQSIGKENINAQMNLKTELEKLNESNVAADRYQKHSRKEGNVKVRHEKSFFKQIFDSKKRHSAIENTTVKLLPNISELDRQATELLNSYKLKSCEQNNNESYTEIDGFKITKPKAQEETWFCTRCLKKYDSTMVTCKDCLSQAKMSNNSTKYKETYLALQNGIQLEPWNRASTSADEKEKLKIMLKEMKDSLPKRPKPDQSKLNGSNSKTHVKKRYSSTETPTLRIGSSIVEDVTIEPQPSLSIQDNTSRTKIIDTTEKEPLKLGRATETVLITQTTVLVDAIKTDNIDVARSNFFKSDQKDLIKAVNKHEAKADQQLKISSLLNPMYIPKKSVNTEVIVASSILLDASKSQKNTESKVTNPIENGTKPKTQSASNVTSSNFLQFLATQQNSKTVIDVPMKSSTDNNASSTILTDSKPSTSKPIIYTDVNEDTKIGITKKSNKTVNEERSTSQSISNFEMNKSENKNSLLSLDQHSKKRVLINQLEKSIAEGDERAAADAAVKLAQLRLSCSVLSFTSQIVSEGIDSKVPIQKLEEIPSTSAFGGTGKAIAKTEASPKMKVDSSTQSFATRCIKAIPSSSKPVATKEYVKCRTNNSSQQNLPGTSVSFMQKPGPSSAINSNNENEDLVTIEVWVEDREAERGPVPLSVPRTGSLGALRSAAASALRAPPALQRWVVGRALCTDDSAALTALAGPQLDAPFYLCLVESEAKVQTPVTSEIKENKEGIEPRTEVYTELVELEQRALLPNAEQFECGVCLEACAADAGAVIRACAHAFCRACLADGVRHAEGGRAPCPATGCAGALEDREVRALLPQDEYERWLARGLAAAESSSRHAFHCRTRDCGGWALCEPGVRTFPCPVCRRDNCVPCQSIHEGETCEEHRTRLRESAAAAAAAGPINSEEGTEALLESLIARGEALKCPECSTVITKKWGCDWVRCAACRTEICWVTRGRRWGPGGRGDTSDGCRCGVDGRRCHPACGYCH